MASALNAYANECNRQAMPMWDLAIRQSLTSLGIIDLWKFYTENNTHRLDCITSIHMREHTIKPHILLTLRQKPSVQSGVLLLFVFCGRYLLLLFCFWIRLCRDTIDYCNFCAQWRGVALFGWIFRPICANHNIGTRAFVFICIAKTSLGNTHTVRADVNSAKMVGWFVCVLALLLVDALPLMITW